jgi:hypothetical protein
VDSGFPYLIGGLRIVRCYAAPGEYKSEKLHWSIGGIVVDPPEVPARGSLRHLALVGELYVHSRGEGVAVSAEAQIRYPGAVPDGLLTDPAVALEEVRRIGEEAQHALYDFAATTARSLVTLTQFSLTVPIVTPEAKIELMADSADDEESSESPD